MANRTVPITVANDHTNVVGWLILSDKITDDQVVQCSFSWTMSPQEKDKSRKLLELALVPELRVAYAQLQKHRCVWNGCKTTAETGYLCDEHITRLEGQ